MKPLKIAVTGQQNALGGHLPRLTNNPMAGARRVDRGGAVLS
jgi:hypothetical protein